MTEQSSRNSNIFAVLTRIDPLSLRVCPGFCPCYLEGREDLETMADIVGAVTQERRIDILDDAKTRWRLEQAVERS
jgi:hypothetical protein